ncbi:MAG: hypothetical protein M1416_00070 [Candidatus Pacearchaeota archaeon]|nr:hypothetical protein [Candidatus Pacearchaeota archaeon]
MVCLNKILEDKPEEKIASKGVQNEEDFFYACKLCDGKNKCCAEYIEDSTGKSQIVTNKKSYLI